MIIAPEYLNPDSLQVQKAEKFFQLHKFVKLQNFMTEQFCKQFSLFLETAVFYESQYDVFLKDSKSKVHEMVGEGKVLDFLSFALNDKALISVISKISALNKLQSFRGRLYKLEAGSGQELGWHDDVHPGKCLAISINLSPEEYLGGDLEIKKTSSNEVWRVPNLTQGDALIFLIDRDYQHRVIAVEGKKSKIAFTGWFLS